MAVAPSTQRAENMAAETNPSTVCIFRLCSTIDIIPHVGCDTCISHLIRGLKSTSFFQAFYVNKITLHNNGTSQSQDAISN